MYSTCSTTSRIRQCYLLSSTFQKRCRTVRESSETLYKVSSMVMQHTTTYENRWKAMNRPSLVYRRYRGDKIEVFKYLHGSHSLPGDSVLQRPPSVGLLRGHNCNLLRRHCHWQLRLQFFSYRVVSLWNNLPVEVVSAPSLNSFKGRIDSYATIVSFLWTSTRLSIDQQWSTKRSFKSLIF